MTLKQATLTNSVLVDIETDPQVWGEPKSIQAIAFFTTEVLHSTTQVVEAQTLLLAISQVEVLVVIGIGIYSLKLTSYPLKIGGWETSLSFWEGLFLYSGYVSFRKGILRRASEQDTLRWEWILCTFETFQTKNEHNCLAHHSSHDISFDPGNLNAFTTDSIDLSNL